MPSAASMVGHAIELSNKANADPSFGKEACRLWTSILKKDNSENVRLPFPNGAMSAAHGLHASTLVRIGRDKEAIIEYTKSLAYLREDGALLLPMTKEESDVRVGMGKSLQRMLRYQEAADAFLCVAARCADINHNVAGEREQKMSWVHLALSNSIQSAALCFMRSGDLDSAMSVLEKYDGKNVEVHGMYGALILIKTCSTTSVLQDVDEHERFQSAMQLLNGVTGYPVSPLYRWIQLTSQINKLLSLPLEPLLCETEDAYLILAKANNSPFDDPGLINLDDKVRLHSVLNSPDCRGKIYWPHGYILPNEYESFLDKEYTSNTEKYINEKKWILKERSGYGSHGNSIASIDELVSMYDAGELAEAVLCQRIVDPPMLISGRKFTLRIYVIYFPGGKSGVVLKDSEVYISSEGLVKYASAPFVGDSADPNAADLDDQYMTNSGRGDGRSTPQHSLHQLQRVFRKNGMDYQMMWESIEESVQAVMKKYAQLQHDDSPDHSSGLSFIRNTYSPLCSIPKIMGFDYILNSSVKPFLLEINRVPGLEPRSSVDSKVKHTIVYDAWVAASDRMGMTRTFVQNLCPSAYKGCSLKRIYLT